MRKSIKIIIQLSILGILSINVFGCQYPTFTTDFKTDKDISEDTENETEAQAEIKTEENIPEVSESEVSHRLLKKRDLKEYTEAEKMVFEYDSAIYHSPNASKKIYSFLNSDSNDFTGIQMQLSGKVVQTVSMDYCKALLVQLGPCKDALEWNGISYDEYYSQHANEFVVIRLNGQDINENWEEGAEIGFRGLFEGKKAWVFNDQKQKYPTFDANNVYIQNIGRWGFYPEIFSQNDIATIVYGLFGNDVPIQLPLHSGIELKNLLMERYENNDMLSELERPLLLTRQRQYSHYICTPNTDSTNELSEMSLYSTGSDGKICLSSNGILKFDNTTSFDRNCNPIAKYTVENFDKSLNKQWTFAISDKDYLQSINRNICYDFTSEDVYVVYNDYLYIIDITTGNTIVDKQTLDGPTDITQIYKIQDGILMVCKDSNSLYLQDLEGNEIWHINASDYETGTTGIGSIQLLNGNIFVSLYTDNEKVHYLLVDSQSGEFLSEYVTE